MCAVSCSRDNHIIICLSYSSSAMASYAQTCAALASPSSAKSWGDYSDEEEGEEETKATSVPKSKRREKPEFFVFSDIYNYTKCEIQLRNVFNSVQSAHEYALAAKHTWFHIYSPSTNTVYVPYAKRKSISLRQITPEKEYCERTQLVIEKSLVYQHYCKNRK
jgi:hypothetical protein